MVAEDDGYQWSVCDDGASVSPTFEILTFVYLRTLLVIVVVNVGVVMTYSVPLADSVAKGLESNARILDKVWHNVFAQPSTIRVLQHQGRVPVI